MSTLKLKKCELTCLIADIWISTKKMGTIAKNNCPDFLVDYALFTEPKSSIFSLTIVFIASAPGAKSFLGSKPFP